MKPREIEALTGRFPFGGTRVALGGAMRWDKIERYGLKLYRRRCIEALEGDITLAHHEHRLSFSDLYSEFPELTFAEREAYQPRFAAMMRKARTIARELGLN